MSDVTRILDRVQQGDPKAAEELLPLVYEALDLAPRTVDRHWAFARAWLKRTIRTSLSGTAEQA